MKHLAGLLALACAQAGAGDLQSCAKIADRDARLACYDALAARALQGPSAPPASAAPTAPSATAAPAVAPSTAAANDRFGLPDTVAGKPQEVRSRIAGHLESWDAKTVFVLANGQHWRVADGTSAYVNLPSPEVRIQSGAIGGYVMHIEGSNRLIRVRRVR